MKYSCLVCNYRWKSKQYLFNCPNCGSKCWDFGHNVKCKVCKNIIMIPHIHHIDGNHKNNSFKNRIPVCPHCHSAIYTGLGKSGRRLKSYGAGNSYIKEIEFEGKRYRRLIFPIVNKKDLLNREKLIQMLKNLEYYQSKLKGQGNIFRIFNDYNKNFKKREREAFKRMVKPIHSSNKKIQNAKNPNQEEIFKKMAEKEWQKHNLMSQKI